MSIWKWLNPKRLRDYPRLVFVASWGVLFLNVLFHHGWIGGLTGIMIGGDFIANYSGGVLYKTDIQNLYNPIVQQEYQESLIAPSHSAGFAPFISPPYVGLAMSGIASIPLPYAFIAWEMINLICVCISAYLITKYLLPDLFSQKYLSLFQFLTIILSSFAFVDGLLSGQAHGIILLLCTGIILAMMRDKWIVAGLLGAILTYKPQFVIGFLIFWLFWRRVSALSSFVALTLIWQIPVILSHGLSPYLDYLQFTRTLLYLPYAKDSFPIAIMATPYAFLATLLPANFAKAIQILFLCILFGFAGLLSYIAYKTKDQTVSKRYIAYSLAILFPLIVAPHTLIYDLLILIPALVLLANTQEMLPDIKLMGVIIYAGVLLLPLLGYITKLALPGLIPVAIMVYIGKSYFRLNKKAAPS